MTEINEAWLTLLERIIGNGKRVRPRDLTTLELLGYQTEIPMSAPLVTLRNRKLGYRFACAEAAWILSGSNRLDEIVGYAKHLREFSDDGLTLAGAYGPKVVEQLSYVVDALVRDPHSRQAVINLWRERPRDSRDVPCTLSLQFLLRDGLLHCVATMRSSDAWLGYPYDVFSFSMIAAWVAIALRRRAQYLVELGSLLLTAGSQHLYVRDQPPAESCLVAGGGAEQEGFAYAPFDVTEFGRPNDLVRLLWNRAAGAPASLLGKRWLAELPHLERPAEPPTTGALPHSVLVGGDGGAPSLEAALRASQNEVKP